jgi:ribonuclease HII
MIFIKNHIKGSTIVTMKMSTRARKPLKKLKRYYGNDTTEIQVGLDEAGRGSFFGPVFTAAVIMDPTLNDPEIDMIRDSKKLSRKKRNELRDYIENNAVAFSVQSCSAVIVDEINILQATYKSFHSCLKHLHELDVKFDRILVDGENFKPFACQIHNCIPKGDDEYVCIAAASILAKTHHDDYIDNACIADPTLDEKYNLKSNMGYGTKQHRDGIVVHGLSDGHRRTFCKKYV